MKKRLFLLLALVLMLACTVLASCDVIDNVISKLPFFDNNGDTELTFADATVKYDGEAKTMTVANLPAGAVVVYSVDGGEPVPAVSIVDAGTYSIEAQITSADGEITKLTATLTIEKADYTLENPTQYFAAHTEIAYDGDYHMPEPIVALPEGLGVVFDKSPVINPNDSQTYTITFTFSDPAMARNYNPPAPVSGIQLSVVKAAVDMSDVVFEDVTVPYDGGSKTLKATGVSDKLRVTYTYLKEGSDEEPTTATPFESGVYVVTATFAFAKPAVDGAFYELPAPMTAKLTIGVGKVVLPNIFNDKRVAYSGDDLYPVVPGDIKDIAGSTLVVTNEEGAVVTEVILPGVYTVTVTFTVADPDRYLVPDPITYTIEVTKATLVLDDPTWGPKGDWGVLYGDGGYFELDNVAGVEITLPEMFKDLGITPAISLTHKLNGTVVEEGEFDKAGQYTTTATITLDDDRYVLPEGYGSEAFTWLVVDKHVDEEDIVFEGDEPVTYDGEGHGLAINYKGEDEKPLDGILGDPTIVVTLNGEEVELPEGGFVNAGTYIYTITFPTDLAAGYAPLTITKTLTIEKALIDLSDVTADWDLELTDGKAFVWYDGQSHTVALTAEKVTELEGLGVTVKGYEDNKAEAVGEYTAIANLACDDNHVLSRDKYEFEWQIAQEKWTDPVQ